MRTRQVILLLMLLLLLLPSPARACMWDSDTLDDEVRGLPEAYTLVVTDRWFRHGDAYYRHRVATLPARIEATPGDLDLYDDLAVAHERLGDRVAAIAVMDRKLARLATAPDRDQEYRAWANRGTFLAHAGRFDEALVDLEKALALNPDAHFGRERFQVMAIRYVKAAKEDPTLWERENFLSFQGVRIEGGILVSRKARSYDGTDRLEAGEGSPPIMVKATVAYTAVVGMLRFGGLEGAELWRTLGDLVLVGVSDSGHYGDLHLAWWCYRRAIEKGHPAADRLRASLVALDDHWSGSSMSDRPTETTYLAMRASASRWQEAFHRAEEAALARGEDPGDENVLATLTATADGDAGAAPPAVVQDWSRYFASTGFRVSAMLLGVAVLIALLVVRFVQDERRKRLAARSLDPSDPSRRSIWGHPL